VGRTPRTIPMWSNAFTKILTVRVNPSSLPNSSFAFLEIFIPSIKRKRNKLNMIAARKKPSSSAIIAKIKSEYDMGRKRSFSFPAPSPNPKKPPEPIPMRDCWI